MTERSSVPRFDGVYFHRWSGTIDDLALDTPPANQYVRFFEDGVVVCVASLGMPTEVIPWLDRTHDDLQRGTWDLRGDQLHMETNDVLSTIQWQGTFIGETLRISARDTDPDDDDNAVQHETTDYQFVSI